MSHTDHSITTIARRIAAVTAAAATLAAAGAASPAAAYQDLRSPDARDAGRQSVVDLRSPDSRDVSRSAATTGQVDLRSPDARDAGRTSSPTSDPAPATGVADDFEWGYLASGLAVLALCIVVLATTRRRGRRPQRHLVGSRG